MGSVPRRPPAHVYFGLPQLACLAGFAAVTAPILVRESPFFAFRAEHLTPLSVLEDDLVAAREDLEGPRQLVHVVEVNGVRLVEPFEIGWQDEIAHRNAFHVE